MTPRARASRRAWGVASLLLSASACSLVVSPSDYLGAGGEGPIIGPPDGGVPFDGGGSLVDGEALGATLLLMGGERDPIGPGSEEAVASEVYATRVLPTGALDTIAPTSALPVRGYVQGERAGDALLLRALGTERGETTRRMFLHGQLAASGSGVTWTINSEPAAPLFDGTSFFKGQHIFTIGAQRNTTVDGGTVTTADMGVWAAPVGTGTGVVQAWREVLPSGDLEPRRVPSRVVDGTHLYLFSGQTLGASPVISATVEVAEIDAAAGTVSPFRKTSPLEIDGTPRRAFDPGIVFHRGFVYVAGGRAGTTSTSTHLDAVSYAPVAADGSIGAWRATSKLPVGLHSFAFYAEGGRLFVIGGRTSSTNRSELVFTNRMRDDGSLDVEWEAATAKLPVKTSGLFVLRL